jgi:hypothetical protein
MNVYQLTSPQKAFSMTLRLQPHRRSIGGVALVAGCLTLAIIDYMEGDIFRPMLPPQDAPRMNHCMLNRQKTSNRRQVRF